MRPDPARITQILPLKREVEGKLLKLPGVTGVDIGFKEVGGEMTDRYAILVFVERKGSYAPEDEIPARIDDVETDVIEAKFEPLRSTSSREAPGVDTKRYDPVQGGAGISPVRLQDGYGSLGMLVEDAHSGEELWLSAYHVMCLDSKWPEADKRIVQPAIAAGGQAAQDTIGEIVRGVHGQVDVSWGYDLYVDAAVCTVSGRTPSASIVRVGTPKGARDATLNEFVTKYGATTEYRNGVIASTNFTAVVNGAIFYYQYRAEPPFPGQPPLAEAGDSGAAVLDSGQYAIGLVTAGSSKYTVVNPIGQILEALKISM